MNTKKGFDCTIAIEPTLSRRWCVPETPPPAGPKPKLSNETPVNNSLIYGTTVPPARLMLAGIKLKQKCTHPFEREPGAD